MMNASQAGWSHSSIVRIFSLAQLVTFFTSARNWKSAENEPKSDFQLKTYLAWISSENLSSNSSLVVCILSCLKKEPKIDFSSTPLSPKSAYVIYGWYLVLMVVGGIRTTTERGLWKINRAVFQLQFTLLNAPLDATLTKDVFRYGWNPSLNTQSCIREPLCSTFRFENLSIIPKKPSFFNFFKLFQ